MKKLIAGKRLLEKMQISRRHPIKPAHLGSRPPRHENCVETGPQVEQGLYENIAVVTGERNISQNNVDYPRVLFVD